MESNNQLNSGYELFSAQPIPSPLTISGDDSIEILAFPTRLENSLKKSGITTIQQFINTPQSKLFKIRNIGPKSVKYLAAIKRQVEKKVRTERDGLKIEDIKKTEPPVPAIPSNQLVSTLLSGCINEREKNIMEMRYGLKTGEKQTLDEIGKFYKLTRERIRQIQAKMLKRLRHPSSYLKRPITDIVETVFYENGGLVTAEEADEKIPRAFDGINNDGSSILDLLCDLHWIQSYKIGDIVIYSSNFDGVSLERLSDKIVNLVKENDFGLGIRTVLAKVQLLHKIKDKRFNANTFISRYCDIDPRIEKINLAETPDTLLRHYTSGHFRRKDWITLMVKILQEEQTPLHFTEISNRVNDLLANSGKRLDVRRAHSMLIENEAFAHSGIRGTYGLSAWGFRKEMTPDLINECLQKAGFPLHWRQIYNYVSKYKDSKPATIISILENHKEFERKGQGIYGFRSQ